MKIFSALTISLLIIFQAVGFAATGTFSANGEYLMSDYDTPEIAEEIALDFAKQSAAEQAGIYLETYSRSVNFELEADEIKTVASSKVEVLEKNISRQFQHDGRILLRADIRATVDTSELDNFIKQEREKRQQAIQQYKDLQRMNAKIKQDIETFQAKLAVIKDEVKDDELIVEQERINREFLSKQKVYEFIYIPFKDKEVQYDIIRIKYDATIINAAIKLNPKNFSAYVLKGFWTFTLDINDINKALILTSDTKTCAALYAARAIPHWKKGDLNRALEDYNKAIQLDPKNSTYYKVRGDFYQNQLKDYDKAFADYATAIKLNPKDVDAYKARGELYESQEKYLEAIKDYQTALKLAPEKLDFDYNKIGDIYKELKDYPRALEYYTKAINQESDPKYAFADTRAAAYLNRAQIYMEQEDYDKAIADCDKGLELAKAALGKNTGTDFYSSLLKDSYDGLISTLEEIRQAALEAKNFTDKHNGIDLNNVETLMERANSNVEKAIYDPHNKYPQENLKRAIEDYTRVLKLDPKNQLALEKRAWTYCTVGEYKLSVADYDKLIKLNPKSVDFWSNRGWAYEKLGELDKALADYDKAIELEPDNETFKESRQRVLDEMKK